MYFFLATILTLLTLYYCLQHQMIAYFIMICAWDENSDQGKVIVNLINNEKKEHSSSCRR
jgi:hypothetical protein